MPVLAIPRRSCADGKQPRTAPRHRGLDGTGPGCLSNVLADRLCHLPGGPTPQSAMLRRMIHPSRSLADDPLILANGGGPQRARERSGSCRASPSSLPRRQGVTNPEPVRSTQAMIEPECRQNLAARIPRIAPLADVGLGSSPNFARRRGVPPPAAIYLVPALGGAAAPSLSERHRDIRHTFRIPSRVCLDPAIRSQIYRVPTEAIMRGCIVPQRSWWLG